MSQELVPSSDKWLPQVEDQNGKPVVGPELDAVTNMMVGYAQLAQMARIRKSVESQNFQGYTDPREVHLSPGNEKYVFDFKNSYPFVPWSYALFENLGPNDASVSINDPFHFFAVHAGAPLKVNRLGATNQRMWVLYFETEAGNTANLNVVGEY